MEKNEDQVLLDIENILRIWGRQAMQLQILLVLLGVIGISSSLFITAFVGSDFVTSTLIRILSFLTTLCLTLISAFNLISKASSYITAWRLLNKAVYSYKAKVIDINILLKAYEDGEKMLGCVDFQYSRTKLQGENNV